MTRKQNRKRKTRQRDGWLNRYDFSYTGRGRINTGLTTLKRISPGLIQNTRNQADKVAQKRIAQAITQGEKEVEKVAPIVIKSNRRTT